ILGSNSYSWSWVPQATTSIILPGNAFYRLQGELDNPLHFRKYCSNLYQSCATPLVGKELWRSQYDFEVINHAEIIHILSSDVSLIDLEMVRNTNIVYNGQCSGLI
ncbi:hypothetical protein Bpfe_013080, partial [Biomphalaria pfeifferi]